MATEASVLVRSSLALNPAMLAGINATPAETNITPAGINTAPAGINAAPAGDADARMRALLTQKLGLLIPSLSAGAQAHLRQQALQMLTELAEHETARVRAVIADVVKDLPDAPRAVILRLAHDAEVTVCEPVIRFSPLLTSGDLVSLVAVAPCTGVAVARRAAIDATVCDAVVAGGTDDAVLALLMNGSAQIKEATLDALVERSIEHPVWHDPLIHRPTLSDQSIKTLSRIVADHLLEVLAARGGLDP